MNNTKVSKALTRVGPSKIIGPVVGLVLALALLFVFACGGSDPVLQPTIPADTGSPAGPVLSEKALQGEVAFNTNCSLCHGINAAGTAQGPTFIDRIYSPGHHADLSFRFAVDQGVRAHHWRFGDMPPVPNVTDQEVEQIICYVRELQRFHGIFEEGDYLTAC